jgi:hypothetical protein
MQKLAVCAAGYFGASEPVKGLSFTPKCFWCQIAGWVQPLVAVKMFQGDSWGTSLEAQHSKGNIGDTGFRRTRKTPVQCDIQGHRFSRPPLPT